MTELEKYQLVNKAETTDELKSAITAIGGEMKFINGRNKSFSVENQIRGIDLILLSDTMMNALTRSYGIRQQMMYLLFYNKISQNANTETNNQEQDSSSTIGDAIETKK